MSCGIIHLGTVHNVRERAIVNGIECFTRMMCCDNCSESWATPLQKFNNDEDLRAADGLSRLRKIPKDYFED